MSRAWSTISVPPRCAPLGRSHSNCGADQLYAPGCKPLWLSNCRTTPLLVPRARYRGSLSSIAQLLEMQLLHAAVVSFGNGNQIIINLNLFPSLRQMSQQMCHVTANGAYVGAFQIKLRQIV